ncbi:hypothetical protein DBO85_18365 [Pseudomonas mangrovi]|uniref:Uncharacterized protein n=1 Tax=Pseudomonas mangrovi TaxID=2161748 RepID=A0A2T5P4Q9_9PSED|nr:hypothetical protein DBO85_18365 [Pseudomonas mangrovi]
MDDAFLIHHQVPQPVQDFRLSLNTLQKAWWTNRALSTLQRIRSTLLDTHLTPAMFWLFGRREAERLPVWDMPVRDMPVRDVPVRDYKPRITRPEPTTIQRQPIVVGPLIRMEPEPNCPDTIGRSEELLACPFRKLPLPFPRFGDIT